VLAHRRITLLTFFVTLATTVVLYAVEPKGFFPQQDTGVIVGLADASRTFPSTRWCACSTASPTSSPRTRTSAGWATSVGGGRPLNNGFVVIGLKPRGEPQGDRRPDRRALRAKLARVQGGPSSSGAQDLNVGGRLSRTQYQYTLLDPNLDELNEWSPKLLAKLQALPQLRDVRHRPADQQRMLSMTIDRDQAARFGIQPR